MPTIQVKKRNFFRGDDRLVRVTIDAFSKGTMRRVAGKDLPPLEVTEWVKTEIKKIEAESS